MKHIYLTSAFFFLFLLSAAAQNKAPYTFLKTGQIKPEDLKMTRYEPDTSAGAVILYDGGRTRVSPNAVNGLTISHDRHVIIKILKKSGYHAADVAFPTFLGTYRNESVQNLEGFTYNLVNGKVVVDKLAKDAIFEELTNPIYNTQKFTMPNVKEGSVLEFTYRVQSPFIQTFKPWNFQHEQPVAWSEYRAEIPENFIYKTLFQGYEPFFATETKPFTMVINVGRNIGSIPFKGTETYWAMKNVPALREEPFISSLLNFQARIEFELTSLNSRYFVEENRYTTWEKVSETLLKDDKFGFYFSRPGFAKEHLPAILKGITDPEKQVAAIHSYVKNALVADNAYTFIPRQPLRKVLETKKASAAEANLLLLCFLREAGFTAEPVLISTRNNGLVTSAIAPNVQKFNYVMVYAKAGEKEFVLDATEPLADMLTLPTRCLNGEGLILSETQPRWVDLRAAGVAKQVYYTKVEFAPDLSMKGKMQVSSTGFAALNQRKEIAKTGEKKFIDDLLNKAGNWELENYSVQQATNPAEALKFDFNFTIPAQSANATTIYFQPIMNQANRQNPLKPDSRKFPVDFMYQTEETFVFNYTIPEGYRIEEQPKNAIVTLPDNGGKYVYSITAAGNSINVISKISIDRPVFGTEEYPYLKEFYNHILAKQAEQIVLKKIN